MQSHITIRRLIAVLLAGALLAPSLAGCGKKADLDPPPGAPKERTYPKPN
jgi:predicted small lipoprotein YifL